METRDIRGCVANVNTLHKVSSYISAKREVTRYIYLDLCVYDLLCNGYIGQIYKFISFSFLEILHKKRERIISRLYSEIYINLEKFGMD